MIGFAERIRTAAASLRRARAESIGRERNGTPCKSRACPENVRSIFSAFVGRGSGSPSWCRSYLPAVNWRLTKCSKLRLSLFTGALGPSQLSRQIGALHWIRTNTESGLSRTLLPIGLLARSAGRDGLESSSGVEPLSVRLVRRHWAEVRRRGYWNGRIPDDWSEWKDSNFHRHAPKACGQPLTHTLNLDSPTRIEPAYYRFAGGSLASRPRVENVLGGGWWDLNPRIERSQRSAFTTWLQPRPNTLKW